MVLQIIFERNEIKYPTMMSKRSILNEGLYESSDATTSTQSSLLSSMTEENEQHKTMSAIDTKMLMITSADDNSMYVVASSHEDNSITNEKNYFKVLSVPNKTNIMQDNLETLKTKLHRVLKKREQYRRRVESLTNGIIAMRGTKLVLERKISGAKLSWDIKQNKNDKM